MKVKDIDWPAIWFLVTPLALFAAIGVVILISCNWKSIVKHKRKSIFGTLAILTAYLWIPWLCYTVRWTFRVNENAINYLERKPIVVPKEPEVIDLNKKEQP